jgi:nitroimidazol reductase NimA-like FMN-containing flavoprotein (pyridoxamine 5'-phosphate oxidase superfamily)
LDRATNESSGPKASRPLMPAGYGVPIDEEGMLTWEQVAELLKGALNYWIATTAKDGTPHVRPVWGAWMDGVLYFDGHPATGWVRNIFRDPRISVQVEAGDVAIILDGLAEDIPQAEDKLAVRLGDEFGAKYSSRYKYTPEPDAWRERGLLCMRPRKVLAWEVAKFSSSATRWSFNGVHASEE